MVICLDICLWCGYSAANHLVKALTTTATEVGLLWVRNVTLYLIDCSSFASTCTTPNFMMAMT